MPLIDRYLLRHLPLPFIIGLGVFVCIMLAEVAWKASGVLVGSGVSFAAVLRYFAYCIPRLAVWSTPVGMLVAVTMAMTSLARAGEVTAMRAGGASLPRIQAPWIAAAALLSGLAVWMNQSVVPTSTKRAYELFQQLTYTAPVAKEAWNELFRGPGGYLFYVRRMNPASGSLEGITIWRRNPRGQVMRLIVAKRATVMGKQWVLEDGYIRDFSPNGTPIGGPRRFRRHPMDMWPALHQYYSQQRTPYEMSITELGALARMLEATGKDAHRLLVHLHFKYSIPCATFVFVLIAGPLAHRYASLGPWAGLLLAIAIVFIYNGIRSWALALGLAGSLHPAIAGWLPNAIMAAGGIALLIAER